MSGKSEKCKEEDAVFCPHCGEIAKEEKPVEKHLAKSEKVLTIEIID